MTTASESLDQLLESYQNSPQPSFKVSNYFLIYSDLFSHLRDQPCTFIETGVLNGGSLFMWRRWLGDQARIIGIDLNPEAKKWEEYGFEIYIGDQGDPEFWKRTLKIIGHFDVLLDDGGHQSFQQIVTLSEAVRAARDKCLIVIEDTCTSFMREFARHGDYNFLKYAKDVTDNLVAKTNHFFPGQFPEINNNASVDYFCNVYSIEFFSGIVAFKIDPVASIRPELIWNRPPKEIATDYRYGGVNSAIVDWPNPFTKETVLVHGGSG